MDWKDISVQQISTLTPSQVSTIPVDKVASIPITQLVALVTTQLSSLSNTQINSIATVSNKVLPYLTDPNQSLKLSTAILIAGICAMIPSAKNDKGELLCVK
jgi:hypothetical protein